jgi:hypothetical protein
MKEQRNIRGHFDWLYPRNHPSNTTMTTRRKSKAREKEAAKKAQLLTELKSLTGTEHPSYARSIDGVTRRWSGVKNHGPSN